LVRPTARAARISARWEIDLSPGTVVSPFNPVDGLARNWLTVTTFSGGGGSGQARNWVCTRKCFLTEPADHGKPARRILIHNAKKGVRVGKPDLGKKHDCTECSTRFYDLNKDPAVCPKCGTKVASPTKARASAKPAANSNETNGKDENKAAAKKLEGEDVEADEDTDDDMDDDDTLIDDDDDDEEVFDPAEGDKK
jgi:hypothetical protein